MRDLANVFAKLAGLRRALENVKGENVSRNRSRGDVLTRAHFSPDLVQHYFVQAAELIEILRLQLPDLYGSFQAIEAIGDTEMSAERDQPSKPNNFSHSRIERLIRDIDQVFEIRANSELQEPKLESVRCVFISHGRSSDWREVQSFIERDVGLPTIELAQEPNLGQTLFEKLALNADRCDCAVIVMTADDIANDGEVRARQNVIHEIGFFQGKYGRNRIVLLHEQGLTMPSNLGGLVYIPFPTRYIGAGLHVLQRELTAMYSL